MNRTATDILIVGAGPAGLAAATELAPHFRVLVLERERHPGGIPRHCGHYPFGIREFHRLMKGPDYARALVERALKAGVEIRTGIDVIALHPGPEISATSDEGVVRITAKRVLLATGVRESSRAQRLLGGTKPGGVLPTGALQGMVYIEGRRPFHRPVILGTELVSLSAIMTCASAGIRPLAMIEPGDQPTARWPTSLYPRLKGVDLRLSTRLVAIEGREQVEAVIIDGPKGRERIETDGVIISGKFRPEATLLANSHLIRDPGTKGPRIDNLGRCSDPAFYAAGNMLRPVETSGWCWSEGRTIGRAILADLQGEQRGPAQPVSIEGEALSWVMPQMIGGKGALDRLQLRVNRPVRGRLVLRIGDKEVVSRRIDSRPERRILLPMPALPHGPAKVVLEEK